MRCQAEREAEAFTQMKQSLEETRSAFDQERTKHQEEVAGLKAELEDQESRMGARIAELEAEVKQARAERDALSSQLNSRAQAQEQQLGKLKRLEVRIEIVVMRTIMLV